MRARRAHFVLLWALLVALAPGCFSLDRDGDGFIDEPPPGGYERDELACADGRDNDQDRRVDCQDSDCLMGGFCGEQVPPEEQRGVERTADFCTDGIDNDGDGQFDCGDRDCQGILELCCVNELDDASCSDGIDNDGNGYSDCQDNSCRSNPYVSVCEQESSCDDRVDNDGDRETDCRDSDCAADVACSPPPEADCANGTDDNADGRADCADPTCAADPACSGPESSLAACSDGFDNDANGFVDCADFGCSRSTDAAILAYCAERTENTLDRCRDGVDNDGNGFTDCADFGCSRSTDAAVLSYCAERTENTFERCTDGIDNDGNGFVDCDDNSCRRGDGAIRMACEGTFATCVDRVDNNGNGYADCGDFSCRIYECDRPGSCEADADCPAGYSCFRNECVRLRSPCMEAPDLGTSFTQVGDGCPDASAAGVTLEERQRQVRASCTDGADNDGDGFVDCEDFDCNYNTLAVGIDGQPLCRSRAARTCVRGSRAGTACASDADCAGVAGSCQAAGGEGRPLVCP
jgi:hypothetical protein